MYARVVTFQVAPAVVDTVVHLFQVKIVPIIQHQQGFHSFTLLVDHASGSCQSISLWNTLAQREATGASSSFLQTQLAPVAEFLLTTPVVENYDVAVRAAAVDRRGE
jgi:hypothetical protein